MFPNSGTDLTNVCFKISKKLPTARLLFIDSVSGTSRDWLPCLIKQAEKPLLSEEHSFFKSWIILLTSKF